MENSNVEILIDSIKIVFGPLQREITHSDQLAIVRDQAIFYYNKYGETHKLDCTSKNIVEKNLVTGKVTDRYRLSENPVEAYYQFSSYFRYDMYFLDVNGDYVHAFKTTEEFFIVSLTKALMQEFSKNRNDGKYPDLAPWEMEK